MKILIVSDTHGSFYKLKQVIDAEKPLDVLIHCGDVCGELTSALGARPGYQVFAVRGNCDMPGRLPAEYVLEFPHHRVFLVHGHMHNVRRDNQKLIRAAKDAGCDMAMYGHTHVPEIVNGDGVLVLNPGSLSEPRTADGRPSYAVMTIDDTTGEAQAELRYADGNMVGLF